MPLLAFYMEQKAETAGLFKLLATSLNPKVIQEALTAESTSNGDLDPQHYRVHSVQTEYVPVAKGSVAPYTIG